MRADVEDYFHFWGKAEKGGGTSFHRLAFHCLDVAAVGEALFEADPRLLDRLAAASGLTPGEARVLMRFALALHDLGKFAEDFQDLQPELSARLRGEPVRRLYRERHDSMGFCLWREVIAAQVFDAGWLEIRRAGSPLDPEDAQDFLEPWFAAALGHHGTPPDASVQNARNLFRKSIPAAQAFVGALVRLFGAVHIEKTEAFHIEKIEADLAPSSWLVAGLAVLCDWIGSNVEWFPHEPVAMPLDAYWPRALAQARRAVEATRVAPAPPTPAEQPRDLFPGLATPSPAQALAWSLPIADGPELLMLEEVTGSGKTEAALLRFQRLLGAGRVQGAFIGLPTMATAKAMHGRIKPLLPRLFAGADDVPFVLAHGAARLADRLEALADFGADEEDEAQRRQGRQEWIADSRKKALLAAFGVGTLDQALLGALHVRHNTLRLLGLSGKVLIADEVHAYDSYTARLLEKLLTLQAGLGGSAILLSATLPLALRRRFARAFADGLGRKDPPALAETAYPLCTRVDRSSECQLPLTCRPGTEKRVAVAFLHEAREVEARLREAVDRGQCACWIRNSVSDAVESFRTLRPLLGDRVQLFHARLVAGDRARREREILERFGPESGPAERAGRLLIATQVVEQSLDLDFDEMVSDLAPIDLLIQRAGRLHRHARQIDGARAGVESRAAPVLYVLSPEFDEAPAQDWLSAAMKRTSFVYPDHAQLWLTMRILRERGAIAVPDEARLLVESVYGDEVDAFIPAGLRRRADGALGKRRCDASLASLNAVELRRGFIGGDGWGEDVEMPTRLGEPTTLLRLARFEEDRLVPLFADPEWAWSQLNVRAGLVSKRRDDAFEEAAVKAAEALMPDKGQWGLTLPMCPSADGRSCARARDAEGRERCVTYSPEEGLLVDDPAGLGKEP